jgi:hypothetical protein
MLYTSQSENKAETPVQLGRSQVIRHTSKIRLLAAKAAIPVVCHGHS